MDKATGKRSRESEPNLFRRGKTWYARVKVNGRDLRPSLRTSSKALARKKLRKILDEADQLRGYVGERYSWKRCVGEWAVEIEGSVKGSVIDRYTTSIKMVEPVLIALHLDEIDTKVIAKIVKHRRSAGATNATIKRDLTAVASVLRHCCAKGWRDDNPAHAYDRSVIRERRDPIVLPELTDVDTIVARCAKGMAGIVRLAQYTGMRQGEIVNLTWDQVRDGPIIDLSKTKTDRARAVALNESASGTLQGTEKHKTSTLVFWHGDGESYKNFRSGFRAVICQAVKDKTLKRAFRFHDLRHLYAVDYLRKGGKIYALQKILGHSSLKTTELYLDFLTPEQAAAAKE